MRIHDDKSVFGWPGDGGLGLRLIAQIRSGAKTATCCPLQLCSSAEVAATRATVGRVLTVVDVTAAPHCNIRVTEVFDTSWGDPDPRVVRGEGFASAASWRAAMAPVWAPLLDLRDDTRLLVELFELARDDE